MPAALAVHDRSRRRSRPPKRDGKRDGDQPVNPQSSAFLGAPVRTRPQRLEEQDRRASLPKDVDKRQGRVPGSELLTCAPRPHVCRSSHVTCEMLLQARCSFSFHRSQVQLAISVYKNAILLTTTHTVIIANGLRPEFLSIDTFCFCTHHRALPLSLLDA